MRPKQHRRQKHSTVLETQAQLMGTELEARMSRRSGTGRLVSEMPTHAITAAEESGRPLSFISISQRRLRPTWSSPTQLFEDCIFRYP